MYVYIYIDMQQSGRSGRRKRTFVAEDREEVSTLRGHWSGWVSAHGLEVHLDGLLVCGRP